MITVSRSTSHCSGLCDELERFAVSRPRIPAPIAVSCVPVRSLPLTARSSPRCRCLRWLSRKSGRTLALTSPIPSLVFPGFRHTEILITQILYMLKTEKYSIGITMMRLCSFVFYALNGLLFSTVYHPIPTSDR